MAAETVDAAIKAFDLKAEAMYPCKTESLKLVGSHGWRKNLYVELIQDYGVDMEVAKHLTDTYGDRAWNVCDMSAKTDIRWPIRGRRIDPAYPYIEAEVRYAARREYAQTAVDVIARRVSIILYHLVSTGASLTLFLICLLLATDAFVIPKLTSRSGSSAQGH